MILAFHNEPSLKTAVMHRLREHRRLDEITQGIYFEGGKGCHLGCLTHASSNQNPHEAAERLFGIELRVGYWLEAIFEGLPKNDCANWVLKGTEAIPCGADLSRCHNHFAAWLLGESGLLKIVDCNRAAIEQVRGLHLRAASGLTVDDVEWAAARSAARSAAESAAESAAWFAGSAAARSAARSAWSAAARSAAWSAGSAAESAAWSARSSAAWSAGSAAWRKMAAKSIEIFAAAPVPSSASRIAPEIESELCCRNLWCRDGVAVSV